MKAMEINQNKIAVTAAVVKLAVKMKTQNRRKVMS